jgi:hypothetical protein
VADADDLTVLALPASPRSCRTPVVRWSSMDKLILQIDAILGDLQAPL